MITGEKLHLLKKYLSSSITKKISKTECTELINISKKIVIPYLVHTKSSFLNLSRIHGLDINDLAIDVIAEVFRQDSEGILVNLVNFVSKLWIDINTISEENLFRAYQSYLRTIADAQIARLYAELDPNGFKIQRNIKELLPTETLDLRKNILGTIIYVKGSEEFDRLPYLSLEDFEKDFLMNAKGKSTTRQLLTILHSQLVCDSNSRKEITIIDTVKLFKKHYKVDQVLDYKEEEFEQLFTDSLTDKFEVEQIYINTLESIRCKIFIDYFSKGKLTLEQATALDRALNDMVFDLINMGKNHISYFDYLKKYIEIEHDEYDFKFKSKLEYLIKQVKDGFRNYLYSKE